MYFLIYLVYLLIFCVDPSLPITWISSHFDNPISQHTELSNADTIANWKCCDCNSLWLSSIFTQAWLFYWDLWSSTGIHGSICVVSIQWTVWTHNYKMFGVVSDVVDLFVSVCFDTWDTKIKNILIIYIQYLLSVQIITQNHPIWELGKYEGLGPTGYVLQTNLKDQPLVVVPTINKSYSIFPFTFVCNWFQW